MPEQKSIALRLAPTEAQARDVRDRVAVLARLDSALGHLDGYYGRERAVRELRAYFVLRGWEWPE